MRTEAQGDEPHQEDAADPHGLGLTLARTTAAALAVSSVEGPQAISQLARQLAQILGVDAALVSVHLPDDTRRMRTLATCVDGRLLRSFEYELARTPCRHVVGRETRYVAQGVHEEFNPGDLFHAKGFDAYAARVLRDTGGQAIGLIVVMNRAPLPPRPLTELLLRIFGVRVAAEIERTRVQAEREASQASYRAIFDASEDGIFVHDFDTFAILDVNPKVCQMYGYTREEMLRVDVGTISENSPPYTQAEAVAWMQRARAGETVRIEWRARHRSGALRWDEVKLKAAVIGGQRRILAMVREITERKEAEAALRASEARYRLLFDMESDAIVLIDTQTLRLMDVNRAACALYGYTRDELLTLRATDLSTDGEATRATITGAASGTVAFPRQHRRRDGRSFPVEITTSRFELDGRPMFLAAVRDVTERRERELAVQRSQERLRATVEAAFDCVIAMDSQGRVLEFNAAAQRCFGHAREAVVGQLLAEMIIPPRLRQAHNHGMARFRRTRQGPYIGRLVETVAMRADGTEFPIELAISVAPGEEGDIFVGYVRDITERKRAEAHRGRLEAQLRQAQKMEAIGQLTGGIAHDFNNILASIMGYVVLAAERPGLQADPKAQAHLEEALQGCRRARDLIQQMLTFSRGQRGTARVLALAQVVDESARILRSMLPSTMRLRLEPLDAHAHVHVDPVQAQQVLLNLAINARDAMQASGEITIGVDEWHADHQVCASCRVPLEGGFVALSVHDTGPGVPSEIVERMFDPFFSTKAPGKGSGMGLAMVHGIVHDHAGHVLVEHPPGGGATFRVLWPRADARRADAVPDAAADPRRAPMRGHVLLVDDEQPVLGFMRELLESWGLTVSAARDPQGALALFEADPQAADLLLTDQTMPGMTGLALAARLRRHRPDMPVLLCSGHVEGIDHAAVRALGACEVLAKPVEPERLRQALAQALAPGDLREIS